MENIILQQLGLSDNQATVYMYLLTNGTQKAGTIAKNVPLKRGLIYKTLDELQELRLVEKSDKAGSVAVFAPLHPSALKSLAERRVRDAQNTAHHVDSEIGSLVSLYNIANNKPGIEFYEGVEGMKKMYDRLLRDATESREILSFVKVLRDDLDASAHAVLKSFITKRTRHGIATRAIAFGDMAGKKLQETDSAQLRETRVTIPKKLPFDFPGGELLICNNALYLTSQEADAHMTVVITSRSLTQLCAMFFYALWDTLERT